MPVLVRCSNPECRQEYRVKEEVLGRSGIFIDTADPAVGATQVAAMLATGDWRARYAALAAANLQRWNALAHGDRDAVIGLIARLAA